MENLDNFFKGSVFQKLSIGVGPTDLDCVLLELNLLSPVGTRVGQQKIPLCEILLFLHGGHGTVCSTAASENLWKSILTWLVTVSCLPSLPVTVRL